MRWDILLKNTHRQIRRYLLAPFPWTVKQLSRWRLVFLYQSIFNVWSGSKCCIGYLRNLSELWCQCSHLKYISCMICCAFFNTIHYGVVKNTSKSFSGLKLWTGYIRFSATIADKDLGLPSTSMQWISSTKKQWTSYLEGFVGETENISAGEHQELTDI